METIVKEFNPKYDNQFHSGLERIDLTPDGYEIPVWSFQGRPEGTVRCIIVIEGEYSNYEETKKQMEYAFENSISGSWEPDLNRKRVLYPYKKV